MEYLGLWVVITGIQPVNKKVESILNIIPPTTKRQVQAFIGLINFYRDTWAIWFHLLQPLTSLTSDKVKFKWTAVEQKSFNDIKRIVACVTLLAYPYFN